ncbi:MAG: hypothetical protein U1E27_01250 [Kiritimatiellia bacterium]|nr:hypothetical protein [Kiritimatiellia bacterium]
MRILQSPFTDIATNLAIEEVLLDETDVLGPSLLFSRNGPAVVFGKNQNAWREARPRRLAASGIVAARRNSGGGTVYHDQGNLNFSFILPREIFNRERQFRVLLRALDRLGVRAELSRDTSLTVGGRKISGSAFALRATTGLHHGTLLFSADLEALTRAIQPPDWSVEGRGIESIRLPVANVSELAPEVTEARWIERLGAEAWIEWGNGVAPEWVGAETVNPSAVAEKRGHWIDDSWVWDGSPPCGISARGPLSSGAEAKIRLSVRAGRIEDVRLESSAGLPPGALLAAAWTGRRLRAELPLPPALPPGWSDFLIGFLNGDVYSSALNAAPKG